MRPEKIVESGNDGVIILREVIFGCDCGIAESVPLELDDQEATQ